MISRGYYLTMHVINRCTEYAVLALLRIASSGEILSAAELAESLDIPHPYLRGILRTLKENSIIRSRRGQNGGFSLDKKPEQINLLEILTIFQGPFRLTECSGDGACRRVASCGLKNAAGLAELEFIRHFREITLSTLLKKEKVW